MTTRTVVASGGMPMVGSAQAAHTLGGWRAVTHDDGGWVMVNVHLQVVMTATGEPVRISNGGQLYVNEAAGTRRRVVPDAAMRTQGAIDPVMTTPALVAAPAGGYLCVKGVNGESLLVQDGALAIGPHGGVLQTDRQGHVWESTGGAPLAVSESLLEDLHVTVRVEVRINLDEVGGYLTVPTSDGGSAIATVDGSVVTQGGAPVRVENGAAPYVEMGGERITLNLNVEANIDWAELAQLVSPQGVSVAAANAPDVEIASAAHPTDAHLMGIATGTTAPASPVVTGGADVAFGGEGAGGEATGAGQVNTAPALDGAAEDGMHAEANISLRLSGAAAGTAGGAPQQVGEQPGIHPLTGRGRASFGMLGGGGIQVDGVHTSLAELGPIAAQVEASANATMPYTPGLEAHVALDHAQLPSGGGESRLVVQLEGGATPLDATAPIRLHLVIDRSSSMHSTWPAVLAASESLLGALRPQDSVQIVAYGSDAEEVLPLTSMAAFSGSAQAGVEALGQIHVGGGTNIEAGLEIAYGSLGSAQTGRDLVILLSDGVPNGGAFGADELGPMASRAFAHGGCTTTTIGLGNQFDPAVLRAIAGAGAGSYHVARDLDVLGPILQAELMAQQRIAARDVQVKVRLPAGTELQDPSLLGEDGLVTLTVPQLQAGESRQLEVPVLIQPGQGSRVVAQVALAYQGASGAVERTKNVRVGFGTTALAGDAFAAYAAADLDLGRSLDVAARAILGGQTEVAASALDAHVVRIDAGAAVDGHASLQFRTQAAGRMAQAIRGITPTASHAERRSFSLALGEMAARLLR